MSLEEPSKDMTFFTWLEHIYGSAVNQAFLFLLNPLIAKLMTSLIVLPYMAIYKKVSELENLIFGQR